MAAIIGSGSEAALPPVAIRQTASSANVCQMAPGARASPRANRLALIAANGRSRPDRSCNQLSN